MKYRREIDGLRALAVLPVILFHAGFTLFGGGFIGVDVFFVISGYLITGIILSEKSAGTFSLVAFYERRARRILPALFLMLAVSVPFAWVWLLPDDLASYARSLVAVPLFASNILFWSESGYFATAAEFKPLLHTWSLGVEEQYYLLFPAFILLVWRFARKWLLPSLVLIALVSFTMAQRRAVVNPGFAFFLLPTRGWELLAGSFLAFCFQHAGKDRLTGGAAVGNAASAAGLAMLAGAVFAFDKDTPFPGVYALLPVVGTMLIILFATPQTLVGRLLGSRALVGLGLISFSAYLWHQPLFAFARHRTSVEPAAGVFAGLSLAALLLAFLSWRYVEQPFRDREVVGRRGVLVLAVAGSLAVIACGLALAGSDNASQARLVSRRANIECGPHQTQDGMCIFGRVDTNKVVVLVGDSHANHFSNALNEAIGKDYKIILIVCGSCFLGDKVRFDGVAESPEVLEDARRSIRRLAQYDVRAVIRAQRWHGYGLDDARKIDAAVEDAFTFSGIRYGQMIVMGSTADVPTRCLTGKYYGKFPGEACEENPASHAVNREFMRATRAMAVPANVHFIYPYEKLCPQDRCTVISNGTLLYGDSHHLTLDGAKPMMDDVRQLLEAADR